MRLLLITLTISLLFGCTEKQSVRRVIDGFAQGTTYRIVYHSDKEIRKHSIDSILSKFDSSCSVYKPSSQITQINKGLIDTLDTNILMCIDIAREVYHASGKRYDITIKPLVEAYGFYSGKKSHEKIDTTYLRSIIGFDKIEVDGNKIIKPKNVQIDLNSLAQGYSVDLVGDWIVEQGIIDFLVEIGGEIYCYGDNRGKGWRVGIDAPIDGNIIPGANLQSIVVLNDMALATSGNYRKNYTTEDGERVNHTFDPLTLKSINNNIASVTILANTAIRADAYATAVMAVGFEKGREMVERDSTLEAMFVSWKCDTLQTYSTSGFKQFVVEL